MLRSVKSVKSAFMVGALLHRRVCTSEKDNSYGVVLTTVKPCVIYGRSAFRFARGRDERPRRANERLSDGRNDVWPLNVQTHIFSRGRRRSKNLALAVRTKLSARGTGRSRRRRRLTEVETVCDGKIGRTSYGEGARVGRGRLNWNWSTVPKESAQLGSTVFINSEKRK